MIAMRSFYNYLRHIQLINWRITVYACKELMCLVKGDSLTPSFNLETLSEYIQDFEENKALKPLPMGAYEYDCCVEYLKKIRHTLSISRDDFSSIVLEFSETNPCNIVIPPIEDCLTMVAKEVGFNIADEKILDDKYVYVLESIF